MKHLLPLLITYLYMDCGFVYGLVRNFFVLRMENCVKCCQFSPCMWHQKQYKLISVDFVRFDLIVPHVYTWKVFVHFNYNEIKILNNNTYNLRLLSANNRSKDTPLIAFPLILNTISVIEPDFALPSALKVIAKLSR